MRRAVYAVVLGVIGLSYLGCGFGDKPKSSDPDAEFQGNYWVRSNNVTAVGTWVALEGDDGKPFTIAIQGVHYELWNGEHVFLRVRRPFLEDRYQIQEIRRLP